MTMFTRRLPEFQNVVAGQTAIIPNLPMDAVYHALLLRFTGGGISGAKDNIELIRIRLGGKVIYELTGLQQQTLNDYFGYGDSNDYMMIPFSDFNARTISGEPIGAIPANLGYSGFSIEIKIKAGTVNPVLEAFRMITNEKQVLDTRYIPYFKSIVPATHDYSAAGTYSLQIPMGGLPGALLKRVNHFHTNITEQTVRIDGVDYIDQITPADANYLQNLLTRVSQAGLYVFDPLTLDNQSDVIPTTIEGADKVIRPRVFEYKTTLSAGDTISTLTELYTTIEAA